MTLIFMDFCSHVPEMMVYGYYSTCIRHYKCSRWTTIIFIISIIIILKVYRIIRTITIICLKLFAIIIVSSYQKRIVPNIKICILSLRVTLKILDSILSLSEIWLDFETHTILYRFTFIYLFLYCCSYSIALNDDGVVVVESIVVGLH